jgi:carboxyl-terminal processing protease
MGIDIDTPDDDDGLQANERAVAKQVAAEAAAKKRPDPLVKETAAILSDAITLLSGNSKLAAQVLPASHGSAWSQ